MKIQVRWQPRKMEFRYPAGRPPRTALLVDWFRGRGEVRVFEKGWSGEAARFHPGAIVGTWAQMQSLMQRADVRPGHAIIVVARPGQGLLSPACREQLWRAFQVPVFEQLIGRHGVLLAAECGAHNGLHIESANVPLDHYAVDASPCACNRTAPRLIAERADVIVRAIAAYAR
jgi:hypothetical protein